MKHTAKVHDHNFVAKHAKRSGAGAHKVKQGNSAPRSRQKHEWRRSVESVRV